MHKNIFTEYIDDREKYSPEKLAELNAEYHPDKAIIELNGVWTMQEVLEALNRKVEENITGNAVVVAVGNAELTPQDTQVRDVFERADQVMYRRKGELKEMGAKTRS